MASDQMAREGAVIAALQDMLSRTNKGLVQSTLNNAVAIVRLDPELAGCCIYNEFTEERQLARPLPSASIGGPPCRGPYPRQWSDTDVTAVTCYLQRAYSTSFKPQAVEAAMASAAEANRVHPVREWLDNLAWDGSPRLDKWLTKAFGAADNQYIRDVGAKTLIGAVRRIRQPGCKFDTMLVLEGDQGTGKSTCIKTLFSSEWFTDQFTGDIRSKDASQDCLGVWCVEFPEILNLIRNDVEPIKAFLSRSIERYRPPYGRTVIQRARQCIFIGSTNADDYLRDATGNRRMWPVECSRADFGWVARERDQLWAEAAHREAQGETIWLDNPATLAVAREEQGARVPLDAWTDLVRAWCRDNYRATVTTAEVLRVGLSIEDIRQDKRAQMRVGDILRLEGWSRTTSRLEGRPAKVWVNPLRTIDEWRAKYHAQAPDDWAEYERR